MSVPPVLASTYHAGGDVGYGRYGNATWSAFEEVIGTLEGGRATAFASGMAAVAAVLDLVEPGGKVVAPGRDGYGGTRALLDRLHRRRFLEYIPVDVSDTPTVLDAVADAALVWIETPTNPLLRIADVTVIAEAARRAGALVVVDNTFATPLLQRPLEMGAHVVVHSATKFLAGHSDLLLGVTVAAQADVERDILQRRRLAGAVPAPLETYLALRGVRTLGVRLDRAQQNAGVLARRLAEHDRVGAVHYPGLKGHPGHDLARRQMRGYGAMLSFEVDGERDAEAVCEATSLIVHATSLGGVETMMERRAKWEGENHLSPGLIRMSTGIENVEDLWSDLETALDAVDG